MRASRLLLVATSVAMLAGSVAPAGAEEPMNALCVIQEPQTGDETLDAPTCTHEWSGADAWSVTAIMVAVASGTEGTDADTVIGIDWDRPNFEGRTLVWAVSDAAGCHAGKAYAVPRMPAGWNDRVRSAKGYQGCRAFVHYEHDNYQGASITCTCSTMGVMDRETSSECWAASRGTCTGATGN